MKFNFPSQFFVTGTDTGIGKTVVSALLAQGLKASYWKPVQSGLHDETDTDTIKRVTDLPAHCIKPETYRLGEPLSPHASARIDGVEIDMGKFKVPDFQTEHLVAEGAGGLMVPLNKEAMIIDLIAQLQMPVLLVARSELGTLNHTFLSIEALRRREIPILGVIMNGPVNESNRKAIEFYGDVPVLAELEPLDMIRSSTLETQFHNLFTD